MVWPEDSDLEEYSDMEADSFESSSEYSGSDHESGKESDEETPPYDRMSDTSDLEPSTSENQPAGVAVNQHLRAPKASPAGSAVDSPVPQLYDGNIHPASYYQGIMQSFNEKDCLRINYAPETAKKMNTQLWEWRQFCKNTLKKPWKVTMKQLDLPTCKSFMTWHLNQKVGKNGKRKRGTKITRSLRTWWDTFRLVFQRETLFSIDWQVNQKAVNNLVDIVGREFNLSNERKENRPMRLDDLVHQIKTTLSTTEKSFNIGEGRILTVLFLLLLAPAGSRPTSVLKMQYKHIDIALHRPKTGPVQLVINLTLEFTKEYRGTKAVKTFILPEVIFDPNMFLSPHIFLLAILFKRRAFHVEKLNDDPTILNRLTLEGNQVQLPIPLKEELSEQYIFCSAERGVDGFKMTKDRLSYGTMNGWLRRVGRIGGFESNARPYTLRYMAGNNMAEEVSISASLRNLVLDHKPNSDTFQNNYLNRCVTFDLWALHRGLEPQQEVVRQAASFGIRRSDYRPIGLSAEQAKALKDDPVYQHYEKLLKTLERGTPAYSDCKREQKAALERLRYAATNKSIGKDWTRQDAIKTIERQLCENNAGHSRQPRSHNAPPMSPAQQRMIDALNQEMKTSLAGQHECKMAAVLELIAYCSIQERHYTQVERPAPVLNGTSRLRHTAKVPPEDDAAQLRKSVFVTFDGQKLDKCYLCVARSLRLPADDPNHGELRRKYASRSSLKKHFERQHLTFMDAEKLPPCPLCVPEFRFKHFKYLQNHALTVHGILQTKIWTGDQKKSQKK